MRRTLAASSVALCCALRPALAWAQADRPAAVVEGIIGAAGFVDESTDWRTLAGGGGRIFVTPRVALGPELVFLEGPEGFYEWTLTGNLTIDLLADRASAPRPIARYVAVGGGYLRQVSLVGGGVNAPPGTVVSFASSEGTVSGGLGARIGLGRRFYVAPELRLGWEPELRLTVTVGYRLGQS
jgi:hypothetical protein